MKKFKLKELCLEITNKCPMKCIHCSAKAEKHLENELTIFEIKKTIEEFHQQGGNILEISGGEPISHPNIFEIITYAAKHEIETRLYTSGFLLTERKINKLISSGLDKIIFNLQGSKSEIHEEITCKEGSFDKVIKNIKILRPKNFWVGVHYVPMKTNYQDMKNVAELCLENDVSEFAILRFVPQGRGFINRKILELEKEDTNDLFKSIGEIKKIENLRTRIGRPFKILSSCYNNFEFKKCNAGITKCLIKPNGDVAPCPAFKQNQRYVIGNIRKSMLKSVWNSSRWDEFREFDYNKMSGNCASCRDLGSCKGGCPAQRILEYGNIYQGPDPSCVSEHLLYQKLTEVPSIDEVIEVSMF